MRSTLLPLALLTACGDAGTATSATTQDPGSTTAPTSGIDPSTPTTTDEPTTTPTTTDDTGDDTTGEPATFCGQLDISLVAHPELDIYNPKQRAAFTAYFEQLVVTTGAPTVTTTSPRPV